ncbi:flagellar biosynthesis protein FlhF, partial [Clostridium perfringens]|nr:flagellar biosynthesis protein FlhF [Clostridium perfringens]
DIITILNGYSELCYEKLVITKLDETSSYGGIYNIVKRSRKPIAYITTGQNVPDDIKIPSNDEIQKLILGEETIC